MMVNLAHRLLRQTGNAKASWRAADEDGRRFIYSASKSSAVIELCDARAEGCGKIRLTLLNSLGSAVDSTTKERNPDESDGTGGSMRNDVLDELYDAAREAALGVAETFRDIFSSLEDRA